MSIENLENLEKRNLLEKIDLSIDEIGGRYNAAVKRLRAAGNLLSLNNFSQFDQTIFSEMYHSFRIFSELMLNIYGYRVAKNTKGHHELAMNCIDITLRDEGLHDEFKRIKMMCKKRGALDYTGGFDISADQLKTMFDDVQKYSRAVGEIILERKNIS